MKKEKNLFPIYLSICMVFCLSIAGKSQIPKERISSTNSSLQFEKLDISVEGKIREVVIDSLRDLAYLSIQTTKGSKLKNEGFLSCYDLQGGTLIWTANIDYDNSAYEVKLELSPEGIPFVVMRSNAIGFEPETGNQKWVVNSHDFRIHPNGKYLLSHETFKLMALFDTNTGKRLWLYKMKFGDTQNVTFTSDSCLMALEKGIHHVDLISGNDWFREIKGIESYNPMSQGGRAGIVAGSAVMFGLIGGIIAAAATSSSSAVGSKTSNYLFETDAIYIAAEYLAKFDHNGSLIWKDDDISKKRGVSSIISLSEDDFILVDFGFRYNSDGLKVRSGDASCEFISKDTGDLHRGIMLRTEGDDFMKDFVLEDQTISFLGKRTLFTIGLETLETLNTREFGGAYANIGLSQFVDPNDYMKIEERFVQILEISAGSLLIRNTANKVVEFDSNLELVKVYNADDFYESKDKYLNYKLIFNSEESLLIDENGVNLYNSNLSENAKFLDAFLVDYRDGNATLVKLK